MKVAVDETNAVIRPQAYLTALGRERGRKGGREGGGRRETREGGDGRRGEEDREGKRE